MTCACEACAPGAPSPTYTREWRHAYEVRYIISLPSRHARADMLSLIEQRRGKQEADRIRAAILDAWPTPTPCRDD